MIDFFDSLAESIAANNFTKLTLSKPSYKSRELINVYVRLISLKDQPTLSFVFRYKTKDETKNFSLKKGREEVKLLLSESFKNATLLTDTESINLQTSKKGKVLITKSRNNASSGTDSGHNLKKQYLVQPDRPYLYQLGVTNSTGEVIPKMADKFRQINKFIEIAEGLISEEKHQTELSMVDMGSGKGYLTFALYDYLTHTKKLKVLARGVELRKDLVDYCNQVAKSCEFNGLRFEQGTIGDWKHEQSIDVLIALHACDTATDDAIASGITSNARVIICAPCCHKQIRQQLKGKQQESPLLKYGIFKERQFEMVTDTIRAMILEGHGYQSKIFEFVSNEHTRKNVMLAGVQKGSANKAQAQKKIDQLKSEFQIDEHYLETLV